MGVTAHWMGQHIPEVLQGDEKNFFYKNKSTWQYQQTRIYIFEKF